MGVPLYCDTEKKNELLTGEKQVFQLVSDITLTAAGPFAPEVCSTHADDNEHQKVHLSIPCHGVIDIK